MDLNVFAKEVADAEGKKISVSIAQIKEIIKITFRKFASLNEGEQKRIIKYYSK